MKPMRTSNYVYGNKKYIDFLQEQMYVEDLKEAGNRITMAVNKQTLDLIANEEKLADLEIQAREMDKLDERLYREQLQRVTEEQHEELINNLKSGFELLSYNLDSIEYGIGRLITTFNWNASRLLASTGHMQDKLQDLIQVVKTPTQTEALEHFEMARDNFRRGLMPEALEELDRAINGVPGSSGGNKTEWRFHQLTGIVRLGYPGCDIGLVDLDLAEKSFLNAARYAASDFPKDAALSFLSASRAAYCNGKMETGLLNADKAMELNPLLGEALFQKAKLYAAMGKFDNALEELGKTLDSDAEFAIKAIGDGDLQKMDAQLQTFLPAYHKCRMAELEKEFNDFIAAEPYRAKLKELPKIRDELFQGKLLMDLADVIKWLNIYKYDIEQLPGRINRYLDIANYSFSEYDYIVSIIEKTRGYDIQKSKEFKDMVFQREDIIKHFIHDSLDNPDYIEKNIQVFQRTIGACARLVISAVQDDYKSKIESVEAESSGVSKKLSDKINEYKEIYKAEESMFSRRS